MLNNLNITLQQFSSYHTTSHLYSSEGIYIIVDCRLAKAREMSQGKKVNVLSWAPLFTDKDEFQESLFFFFLSN